MNGDTDGVLTLQSINDVQNSAYSAYTITRDGTNGIVVGSISERQRLHWNDGPTTKLGVAGEIQVTGTGSPTTGVGLELRGGATPYIQAYNRDTPGYLPLKVCMEALLLLTQV